MGGGIGEANLGKGKTGDDPISSVLPPQRGGCIGHRVGGGRGGRMEIRSGGGIRQSREKKREMKGEKTGGSHQPVSPWAPIAASYGQAEGRERA